MEIIISADDATSAGLEATVTPFRSDIFSKERFQTISSLPVSIRRSQIARPILPTPINPSNIV